MEPDPGELIASGRAADVYDLGGGRVLRRYRVDHDVEYESRVMEWVADQGVRVPRVWSAGGRDIVTTRIEGPTLLEDLQRRSWRILRHARLLADLQRGIGALRAPEWMRHDDRVPAGAALLHLDLHPMNVMLGPEGPVVIDWTNAGRGDPWFDAAISFVLMSAAELRGRDALARGVMVRTFAARRGRPQLMSQVGAACAFRLQDPAVTAHERVALERLAVRAADG